MGTLFLCNPQEYYVTELNALAKDNWRGVVVIRDPLSMLVSGYAYHMQSDDCNGCDCEKMKQVDLMQGLQIQLQCTKNELGIIINTYQIAQESPNMMVVRLEDFMESSNRFDETMKKIYKHLTSDRIDGSEKFVSLTSDLDLRRNTKPPGIDAGGGEHISPEEQTKKVMKAVE